MQHQIEKTIIKNICTQLNELALEYYCRGGKEKSMTKARYQIMRDFFHGVDSETERGLVMDSTQYIVRSGQVHNVL